MTQDKAKSHRVGVSLIPNRGAGSSSPYGIQSLVEGLVHDAMLQAGFGIKNAEAPLCDIIKPGMTVLLKPNWVLHYNQSGETMDCMVTHPTFILAALKEVLAAKPGRVIIADAPIQSCQFDAIATPAWRRQVEQIATCPVEIIDFRKTIVREGYLEEGATRNAARSEDQYVLFDMKQDSLLEPTSCPIGRFRNTSYHPDAMTRTHRPGCHQYMICREVFEVDVIINLPKLKAHRKAGVTAALKNLVGINGDKDYLPHHRLGGSVLGGDCYPGISPIKRVVEFCFDNANRNIGHDRYKFWYRPIPKLLKWQRRFGDTEIEGGWYGNDTTWRMTLDLNRIAMYGHPDGTLSDVPLRKIYSLTDALVAGEGTGPLAPTPKNLGVVTFAASSSYADLVHCYLMRFDPQKIPLVREAFGDFRFPLTNGDAEQCEVFLHDRRLSLEELAATVGCSFEPPRGWKGHVELTRVSM